MSQNAPAWYADPADASQLRYWDGFTWSNYTVPGDGGPKVKSNPTAVAPQGAPTATAAKVVGRFQVVMVVGSLGFPAALAIFFLFLIFTSDNPNWIAAGFCVVVILFLLFIILRVVRAVVIYHSFTDALVAPRVPNDWTLAARGEISNLNTDVFLVFRTTSNPEQIKGNLAAVLGKHLDWKPGKRPISGGPATDPARAAASEWYALDKHLVYTITGKPFTPTAPSAPVVAAPAKGELLVIMDSDLKTRQ